LLDSGAEGIPRVVTNAKEVLRCSAPLGSAAVLPFTCFVPSAVARDLGLMDSLPMSAVNAVVFGGF